MNARHPPDVLHQLLDGGVLDDAAPPLVHLGGRHVGGGGARGGGRAGGVEKKKRKKGRYGQSSPLGGVSCPSVNQRTHGGDEESEAWMGSVSGTKGSSPGALLMSR